MKRIVPKTNPPLRDFLEREFIVPKVVHGTLTKGTAKYYRTIVNRLEQFAEHDLTCREVTDELLDRFTFWMLDHGYARLTAYDYRSRIRSVLRRWNPNHLSNEPGVAKNGGRCLNFVDADESGTLEEICVRRYLPQNPKTTSEQSRRMYGYALRYFGEYLSRPARIDDLNDEAVAGFQRWLVDVRGNKPITANGYGKRIKALWAWCAKKRIVAEFPTVGNLPVAEVIPAAWLPDELRMLVRACEKQEGYIGRIPASAFWTAFHFVLFDTGERTGAMLDLQWDMLDWKTRYLSVTAEVRKGGAKPAIYKLKPMTIEKLRLIRSPARDLVFAIPWKGSAFYHHYRKLVESAGLNYVKSKTGPQKMRRTFASMIEAAGGNATKALKHTDRRVTERSYLDPRVCDTHDENEKLLPLTATA